MNGEHVLIRARSLALGSGWEPGSALCVDTGLGGNAYLATALRVELVNPSAVPIGGGDVLELVEATYDDALPASHRRTLRRLLVDLGVWPEDRPL